jgi:hypothetical protein
VSFSSPDTCTHICLKVKLLKLSLGQPQTRMAGGERGIAQYILNLMPLDRSDCSTSHLSYLIHGKRTSGIYWLGGWASFLAGVDVWGEKNSP